MHRHFSSDDRAHTRSYRQDEQRRLDRAPEQKFDRLAFALLALRVLRPPMTVAVFERRRSLSVERGRDLARGPDARWAMVGIPPDASREHIVVALAELAGADDVPFLVDLLTRLEATPA